MDTNILFLIGSLILLGIFAGKIFQKLKIPQVIGYLIVGVVLGKSFLGTVGDSHIDILNDLINFMLGVIGFLIGGELRSGVFKKYGRSIYVMLISEGMLAFIAVALAVTLLTGKLYLGLLLGAIASATDPASTTNVLWEYKARGPLTTTVTSIVALDDVLALLIYGLVSVFSKAMIAGEHLSWVYSIEGPLFEIFKCLLLGLGAGLVLAKAIGYVKEKALCLAMALGTVVLAVSLSVMLNLDLILTNMIIGITVANIIPDISKKLFDSVKEVSTPLNILFFTLVGTILDIHMFVKVSMLIIVFAYLLGRSLGKIFGATLGALITKAHKSVTKYTGICLFTQGGVAMGLAMSLNHNLSVLGPEAAETGTVIVSIVAATTFVVQLLGPILVKKGIENADEVWRDVTKEDIIESLKVSDVMQKDFSLIKENANLRNILQTVKERESYHFPVVDSHQKFKGLITLGTLRNAFLEEQLNNVILAKDIANHTDRIIYQQQPLKEAFDMFEAREIEYLPVIESRDSQRVVGILEYLPLSEAINRKFLERQEGLESS